MYVRDSFTRTLNSEPYSTALAKARVALIRTGIYLQADDLAANLNMYIRTYHT